MAKEVVAKRGCTCCGTGCVIPAVVIPIFSFGLSGLIGWMIAVGVALPVSVGVMHGLAFIDRRR